MASISEQLDNLLNSGNCPVDGDGNFLPAPTDDAVAKICNELVPGLCCPNDGPKQVFELTESNDSCLINDYVEEIINIGAAVVNALSKWVKLEIIRICR